MIRPLPILALLALAPAALAQKPAITPSIYGADDRKDLYEAAPEHRKLAESVAAFLPKDKLSAVGKSGTWFFKAPPWESVGGKPLCPDVKFRGQPSGSDCTATLVAPRLVLTAAHCVEDDACSTHRIAFGYGMTTKNRWPTNFSAADLYDCKVVSKGYGGHEDDWALLSLDRPVPPERAPLKMAEGGSPKVESKILTIGTPSGLPLKVATNGTVLRSHAPFFESELDSLGGNSGGAVFAEGSSEILGIVAIGGATYGQYRGEDCVHVYTYGPTAARDNTAVLTSAVSASKFLPAYRKAVADQAKADADAAQKAADAKASADKAGEKTKAVIRGTGWIPVDEWPGKK